MLGSSHQPSISSTLNVQIFRTNVVSAAFFTYICTYIRRKKAAEMTFVQKSAQKTLMKLTPGHKSHCYNEGQKKTEETKELPHSVIMYFIRPSTFTCYNCDITRSM
jgi:hypothetical protein